MIKYSGKRTIEDLSGLGRIYPIPMVAFFCYLSMVGIPPLAGFMSKWHLGWGALEANPSVLLVLLSSLSNGFYYLPIVIGGFFKLGCSGNQGGKFRQVLRFRCWS